MNIPPINIGGTVPMTTIDYPGHLACVVFCQGCGWRCAYCHNAHLQPFMKTTDLHAKRWEEFMKFLKDRMGFLDAVVFSGGEPTLQPRLPQAMEGIRGLGFKMGLHTAGPDPDRLLEALKHTDWVGLDIKAPLDERYANLTGGGIPERVKESLRRVMASGIPYQLRTTVHPELLSSDEVEEIQKELKAFGANPPVIQSARPVFRISREPKSTTETMNHKSGLKSGGLDLVCIDPSPVNYSLLEA